MQSKEYKVFKVTINYSEDQKSANNVELIEFPSDIDAKNAILHHLLQSYRTTKDENKMISFDKIDDAEKNQTVDQKIASLKTQSFKKKEDSDEIASKGQEFLVIQSPLEMEEFFKYIRDCVVGKVKEAHLKISENNFWWHRSTWMSVTMLISITLLILAFTVSLPVMEVLMVILGLLFIASVTASSVKAFFDFGLFVASSYNFFETVIDLIKNNPAQTIIASVGIALSLVGLGALLGFFPIIGPALTLACGCSLFMYAFVLAVVGPTTIADAINRYLDIRQAENIVEDFKGEKPITLVPVNGPQNPTGPKVVKAVFSKDVDKEREEENTSKPGTGYELIKSRAMAALS